MFSRIENKGQVFVWSMYDFANQPFTVLVLTFVYSSFFTTVIASDKIVGTQQWSNAVSFTAIVVALLSPFIGTLADKGGYRKLFLIVFTWMTIISTAALYYVLPGEVMPALILFVIANIGFEMGCVFYNAYLPEISNSKNIGRISGYGWSLGYFGGLIALTIALLLLVQTDTPIFGFAKGLEGAYENIRATNLLVALWFTIFTIPTFLFLHDSKPKNKDIIRNFKKSLIDFKSTAKDLLSYPEIIKLLIARLFYNDGLVTIFSFGGIYAAGTLDFSFEEIMVLGIVLNITAGFGSLFMGYLDDKFGGRRTIKVTLVGLMISILLAVFAPEIRPLSQLVFGGINIPIWLNGKNIFWISAILIGFFSGPNQAASRSLMARFTPNNKQNKFFGFFAFSGKATSFLGPFLFGTLTMLFNSQRVGISMIFIFFLVGYLLLNKVNESKGINECVIGK